MPETAKERVRSCSRLAAGVASLALTLAASPAGAVYCQDWNTEAFFIATSVNELKACLAEGADPLARHPQNGWTPLHLAVRDHDDTGLARALLKAGGDPNARDGDGATPLHWAAASGNRYAIELLLANGTDVDAVTMNERTPLHRAVMEKKNAEAVEILLAYGADANARDEHGWTPLHWAVNDRFHVERMASVFGNPSKVGEFYALIGLPIVTALLEAGANPDVRGVVEGATPLHWSVKFASNPAFAEALLATGADLMVQDDNGATPLHWAARNATDPITAMALLDAGADPMARNDKGETVWDLLQTNAALRGTEFYERLRVLAGE